MSEIKHGVVKFFNDAKGFGFIIPSDGGADLFVYRSSINKNSIGLRTLSDDQEVEFEVEENEKGLIAVNVTPK
jgi:CspA family cold shock protein